MKWEKKDILGIKELSLEEINFILDTADSFVEISTRDIKKVPTLRGKTIINLFIEASTRTRTSFEIAGKRLSADTINITASSSSLVKGETLIDTARNLEAMNPDIVVIRHSAAGAPHMIAKLIKQSIINAGDGAHEHPHFVNHTKDISFCHGCIRPHHKIRPAQCVKMSRMVCAIKRGVQQLTQEFCRTRRVHFIGHIPSFRCRHIMRLGADPANAVGD